VIVDKGQVAEHVEPSLSHVPQESVLEDALVRVELVRVDGVDEVGGELHVAVQPAEGLVRRG
jgi:hypothetical protein